MTTVLIQLLICGPVLIPLVAAAAVAFLRRHDAVARVATLGTTVTRNGPVTGVFDLLAVDALSAFMLVVIGAVALIVGLVAPAHLRVEVAAGRLDEPGRTRHLVLVQLFLAAMAS